MCRPGCISIPSMSAPRPALPMIAAVKAMVTVGEISDVYREVFGQYRDPAWL